VHHTASVDTRFTAREVAGYQTGPGAHLPFPSIAYALYVEGDGTVEQTNDLEAVTWHCGQDGDAVIEGVSVKNWHGVAVCFAGNEPSPMQIEGLQTACRWIEQQVGRELPRLGHRDLSMTECPGKTWEQWQAAI